MRGSVEVMVLAGAELAARRIEPRVREAGYRLFAVVHSMEEAVQAMERGPLQPERAARVCPDVLLVDLALMRTGPQDAIAGLVRALDVPAVYVSDDTEALACSWQERARDTSTIISSLAPRELSLAIELALCRRENGRLRAWQHGGVVSAALLEEDSRGVPVHAGSPGDRRWRYLLSSTPAILYCCQASGDHRITFMSENVSTLLGYHTHQFIDEPGFWPERVHPEDRSRFRIGLRATAEGDAYVGEYRFLHRDGTYRWILDTRRTICDETGESADIVGSWMDITERKQAEEALRESEERYKAIVEDQTELICRFLPEGVLTFVNEAYCRYFGMKPEDLVGKSFMPLIPEEDKEVAHHAFASLRPDNPLVTCEHRVILPGGEIRWQSWTDRVILDDTGKIVEYQSVGRDITEQKQVEEALRESEERYKAIVEDQTELICRYLPGGVLTFVNGAYCRYFGKQPEDLVGKSFMPLIPEEDRDIPRDSFSSLGPGNPMATCEHRVILPGGEVRWHTWTNRIIQDRTGKIVQYQAVGSDITERKHAEDALKASEARYVSIFQMAAVPIWESDVSRVLGAIADLRAGGVTDFRRYAEEQPAQVLEIARYSKLVNINGEALRLFGADRMEEVMDSFDKIFLPESTSMMLDTFVALAEGQSHYEGELDIHNLQGDRLTVLLRVSFPSRERQLDHMLLSCVDITERKRAEEKITRLNEDLRRRATELEAANAELESFSYSVSHDLRAPLRAIDGFSKAVIEDYADLLDDRGRGYLQRVRQASQRMSRLIDDLLELSRMTRSAMQLQTCDLSAMAHAVMRELRKSQPAREVAISIESGMRVHADPNLLRVVMVNLLGNAWKFTARQAHAQILVGTTRRAGRLAYFVRDDGAGFDMAYVNKLFGAFQRLHRVDEFDGTGIGLATVKRIIRRHGGDIWAEGKVGEGATFTFTLS